ncbi:MAG: SUMF1/EgtB/PvdO family nonheme iron enzyme [Haliscomenobacter sp.]|uniref:SUMF1/EgtB/PvdO family nonheme iron enzyme n=1 Tax=Haliscomenobacter sp. TaxID=2717303 RepID=UPI0029BF691B|nr:SUMF1/EgtB/PvdO family nonheme iron enzyme [Haliscomenobacter sp.]MDX2069138.1 SUMF1/EgtB/PvdO family nonheme iron enzyme [Haliscomenobacter sp.]
MTKEDIQQLVAKGELKKAIEHLLGLTKNKADHADTHNALLLNSSRLSDLDKQRNQGTIELGNELLTKNQVTGAVLELLNQLPVDFWTAPATLSPLEELRTAPLLLDFVKKHGDAYEHDHGLFTEFSEAVKKAFSTVKERDLLRILGEVYTAHQEIPQLVGAFVANNLGKWKTSQWVDFKEDIFGWYGEVLSGQDLAAVVEEKKKRFAEVFKDFVHIKGGQFMMGAPEADKDASKDEKPQHEVKLSDFYLGKYAITLAQFAEFIEATGYQTNADKGGGRSVWTGKIWEMKAGVNWRYDVKSNPQTNPQHPVIHVSWNDAIAFCNYWNEKFGLRPSYDTQGNLLNTQGKITTDLRQVQGFRLPSEAEWEYACRAGTSSLYYTGDQLSPKQANFGCYLDRTQVVGSYSPNPWGLYDMLGNVLEWCQDVFDADFYEKCKKQGRIINPLNVQDDTFRVLRGGGWGNVPQGCRPSNRSGYPPASCDFDLGFRVVLGSPSR